MFMLHSLPFWGERKQTRAARLVRVCTGSQREVEAGTWEPCFSHDSMRCAYISSQTFFKTNLALTSRGAQPSRVDLAVFPNGQQEQLWSGWVVPRGRGLTRQIWLHLGAALAVLCGWQQTFPPLSHSGLSACFVSGIMIGGWEEKTRKIPPLSVRSFQSGRGKD